MHEAIRLLAAIDQALARLDALERELADPADWWRRGDPEPEWCEGED